MHAGTHYDFRTHPQLNITSAFAPQSLKGRKKSQKL